MTRRVPTGARLWLTCTRPLPATARGTPQSVRKKTAHVRQLPQVPLHPLLAQPPPRPSPAPPTPPPLPPPLPPPNATSPWPLVPPTAATHAPPSADPRQKPAV